VGSAIGKPLYTNYATDSKEMLDYAHTFIDMAADSKFPRHIHVRHGEGFAKVPLGYP